jgi:glucans biosynthesis protein
VSETLDLPVVDLSAGTGTLSSALVERHPGIKGVRVSFTLDSGSADMSELRLTLKRGDQYVSETWLYRWTA